MVRKAPYDKERQYRGWRVGKFVDYGVVLDKA
jgi:hypothetical protein